MSSFWNNVVSLKLPHVSVDCGVAESIAAAMLAAAEKVVADWNIASQRLSVMINFYS
jgi:hypothetical protein